MFSLSLFMCLLFSAKSERYIKDVIGFPEFDENLNTANKQNRTPIFIPSICKENELFYPGDHTDDWICDCRPGHIYHVSTDSCWPAYRQGPCGTGEYLTLPTNSIIPECEKNPCELDRLVLWNGKCEMLETTSPCGNTYPPVFLRINGTTLSMECMALDFSFRISDSTEIQPGVCLPGCKRNIKKKLEIRIKVI